MMVTVTAITKQAKSVEEALELLIENRLICERGIRALKIKRGVDALIARGMVKSRAIEQVSFDMGLSDSLVGKIYYGRLR